MITAVHTLVYADDPDAARAFFRDVLRWPHVDAHDGWLIFKTGPSELGVHPAEMDATHHEISLLCDDIAATVDELAERGAKFDGGVVDRGFGLCVTMRIPGSGSMLLYQPRHPVAYPK
ncbi:VOC family protein [Nocardia goodfellowii]|uniref:Enzyme related to lactoylglutathione lyase n=1 Tax=Nocardia goodfellowii TaxID=882446 RepID=A0ABS4Q9S5_9NOCA|nr:VOC family protein [Nocardia goodfellowii]MBP2188445.1 putative enzyme related to lactoylglutathione lyase [Nocardia goodfellowii]